MVLPAGASTPEENAPPRIGAGSFELRITLLDKATSRSSPPLPPVRYHPPSPQAEVNSPISRFRGGRRKVQRTFDVRPVREQFPALRRKHDGRSVAYFDGPGGSQVARTAIEAMANYMERGGANLHGVFPTSTETEEILTETHRAAADFLETSPGEIAFGTNMTTLTFAVSRALARDWDEDSEIVVTELDHRANVDPWTIAAAERGAKVRWIRVDPETLTLDLDDLETKITTCIRLVAMGLASNADRTHEAGGLVAVDAVHAAPDISIDRDAIGADVITCSAHKFFGPHVGLTA